MTSVRHIPGGNAGVLTVLLPYVRHCGDEPRPAWHLGERRLLDHLVVGIASGQGRFRCRRRIPPWPSCLACTAVRRRGAASP